MTPTEHEIDMAIFSAIDGGRTSTLDITEGVFHPTYGFRVTASKASKRRLVHKRLNALRKKGRLMLLAGKWVKA